MSERATRVKNCDGCGRCLADGAVVPVLVPIRRIAGIDWVVRHCVATLPAVTTRATRQGVDCVVRRDASAV